MNTLTKNNKSSDRKSENTIREYWRELHKLNIKLEKLQAQNNELSFVLFIVFSLLVSSLIYIGITYK